MLSASAQHPGDATWDVTYTLSVTNPATTTGLVYSLTDTPGFPEGVSVNTATVTAAQDSAGQPITGLINTWDGSTLSIVGAKDLAAGVTDTYTVVINTTGTAQDVSTSQCQAGGSAHGYVNTGAVTSGEDSFTAQACTDIRQPDLPPAPTPTPPTPPPPAPAPGVHRSRSIRIPDDSVRTPDRGNTAPADLPPSDSSGVSPTATET